jgi:hypothetical protein
MPDATPRGGAAAGLPQERLVPLPRDSCELVPLPRTARELFVPGPLRCEQKLDS